MQNEKGELFYIENNQKRPFINTVAFRKFKFSIQDIIKVLQRSLDQFLDGPPIYPTLKWPPYFIISLLPSRKILRIVPRRSIINKTKEKAPKPTVLLKD